MKEDKWFQARDLAWGPGGGIAAGFVAFFLWGPTNCDYQTGICTNSFGSTDTTIPGEAAFWIGAIVGLICAGIAVAIRYLRRSPTGQNTQG